LSHEQQIPILVKVKHCVEVFLFFFDFRNSGGPGICAVSGYLFNISLSFLSTSETHHLENSFLVDGDTLACKIIGRADDAAKDEELECWLNIDVRI
jgi:hypothetical protein